MAVSIAGALEASRIVHHRTDTRGWLAARSLPMATPDPSSASAPRSGRTKRGFAIDTQVPLAVVAGRRRLLRHRSRRGIGRTLVGLLAIAGLSVVTRSTSDSRASYSDADVPNRAAVEGSPAANAPSNTKARSRVRFRPHCPECGVVESIRRYGVLEGNLDPDGVVQVDAGSGFEVTIRHRDGSVTVLDEPTARTWRPGSRITLIAGGDGPAP
jgi:hypothetical protein